jgi:RHS repeat-associated protein
MTVALIVVVALGASGRNALLQESAVKAASDRFERQMHGYSTPTVSQTSMPKSNSDGAHNASQSKVPLLAVPRGIDEGNWYIAQTTGGSGGAGGGAVYDPERRIVKIVETRSGTVTSTIQFVWSGDQLCESRDASGNVLSRFYNLGEQISGTNYYFTRDHNDSVREMTNSSGVVQSQFNYDMYGRPTQIAGTGVVPDFGFAGMYIHQPSGLNLAVDRAYNPSLGRWMTRDPIDDSSFAIDPRGPEPEDPGAMQMASGFGQGPI